MVGLSPQLPRANDCRQQSDQRPTGQPLAVELAGYRKVEIELSDPISYFLKKFGIQIHILISLYIKYI